MSSTSPVVGAPVPAPGGRGTRAVIDLSAFEDNLAVLRAHCGQGRVMAVVKANAYGHGIEPVVRTLAGVDGFAVATLGEAERVRSVTKRHPVLLLEGVLGAEELEAAAALDLWITVHSPWQIDLIEAARPRQPLRVWLKVDTGMNRLGFRMSDAPGALARLRACSHVDGDVVLMSHLANADDLDDPKTLHQVSRLEDLSRSLDLSVCSLANSAGALGWPTSRRSWVRVGIGLYGASPLLGRTASDLGLRPAMTLESTLIAINRCELGDAVGYGGAWRCPEAMAVGVVGIGYGDGYSRHASNGTPVDVGGRLCPLVGRVSMDMLCVDLRHVPEARIGDVVQLWGDRLPVETVALAAETICYELLCGVTARVPAIYR